MNTSIWIRRMHHDGLSSSSLSTRVTSSLTHLTKATGICFWSYVKFYDTSITSQYFRCFFRQQDVSFKASRLSILILQPGSHPPTAIVPWIRFQKSASTTLHTQH